MRRIALATALMSFISSVVHAQAPQVTPAQCDQLRQKLSRGEKLSVNEGALFVRCVSQTPHSWGNIPIAPAPTVGADIKLTTPSTEAYAVVPGRPICGIGGRAPAAAIRAHEALRGRCLNRNAAQRASSGKLA